MSKFSSDTKVVRMAAETVKEVFTEKQNTLTSREQLAALEESLLNDIRQEALPEKFQRATEGFKEVLEAAMDPVGEGGLLGLDANIQPMRPKQPMVSKLPNPTLGLS